MNIKKAIHFFINHCQYEKNLSRRTIKAYKSDLDQFISSINIKKTTMVNKEKIKQYIYFMQSYLKPKSIKRKIATLKCFFKYLEFEDIIRTNPFHKVKIKIKLPQRLPKYLNLREIKQILIQMYGQKSLHTIKKWNYKSLLRDIAIIECLFATGIRVSELCFLKEKNIDFQTRSMKIRGKGNKERILHLNAEFLTALAEYRKHCRAEISNCGYLFINRLKKRISDQSVRNIVSKYAKLAGIAQRVTPHLFRHSFASHLLNEGVSLRYIQEFLGHASITTTQIYSHICTIKQKEILTERHPRRLISF